MAVKRLQGTDGVRGLAVPGDHPLARGRDALDAYTQGAALTPDFAERYAFVSAGWLLGRADEEALLSPAALVFAWDPRDADGAFSGAVLRGLLKSGAHVLVAGILPTPVAAAYLAAVGGAGALVLTASHNPAEQNGIKLFLPPHSSKPLPEEDEELSARIWALPWERVAEAPESGPCTDAAAEARAFYADHIARLPNCWLREGALARWRVVIDPARGAWSGLAAEVVGQLGPLALREVNVLGQGPVNEGGGVIALEGRRAVAGAERELIGSHAGLRALFEAGREAADTLRAGEAFAAAGVFDADGDRAYTLIYDPFEDAVRVLGGDEALVLQARFLAREGELPEGGAAVLTIESDAGAAGALADLGLSVRFAPVGDKWVLRAAARLGDGFVMGGEESGHTVVPALLNDALGRTVRLAVGDGLKSFLNTVAAVGALAEETAPEALYAALRAPFPAGFKRSLYAYHVDRARLAPGGETWEALSRALAGAVEADPPGGAALRWAPLEDDPEVMYLALDDAHGRPRGAVYVRNSGTESRTGVVLRGPAEWEAALVRAGEAVLREILARMKSETDPHARAERALLAALEGGEAAREALEGEIARDAEARFGAAVRPARVLRDAVRGGLAREEGGRLGLTALGRWYLEGCA